MCIRDSNNAGTDPLYPKLTVQSAIDACVDGRGDVIKRAPGNDNTLTAPILMNKEGVTLMAATYGAAPTQGAEAGFATWPGAGYATGPMVIVSEPCAIIGMEFVTRNVNSGFNDDGTDSGAALVFIGNAGGEAGGFSLIQNCRFVDWWGNDWGIEFAAGAYNLIRDCTFEGFAAGCYFRGTALRNPESNRLDDNWFKDCVNGIEHRLGSAPHNFLYYRNKFIDISGDSIDSNGGLGDGMIAGNFYETATDAATYDLTVANLAIAGIHCAGNNYQE